MFKEEKFVIFLRLSGFIQLNNSIYVNADEMHTLCCALQHLATHGKMYFSPCLCTEFYSQEEERDYENLGHVAENFSRKFSVCYCIQSLKFFHEPHLQAEGTRGC